MAAPENLLHAANVIVSTVGTITADGIIPGAGSGIAAIMSTLPLAKLWRREPGTLDQEVARQLAEALERKHLARDHDRLIPQMIERGALTAKEINASARDPAAITDAMLAKLTDPAHQPPMLRQSFRDVVTPIFANLLSRKDVATTLRPEFENAVAQSLQHIQGVTEELLKRSDAQARAFGIKEGMLIALARRYATSDVDDFDSALAGLEAALDVAREEAQRLPGNTDDAVNEIIRRVDALNDDGDLDQGWDALQDALARHDQAKMRLLDKAISQAVFRADADGVAQLTLDKLRLDHPAPDALFDALSAERRTWYERGRDQGVGFDLEVAIALAEHSRALAQTPDQSGTALNDLGIALGTLGERDSGTARLEAAVTAFEQALLEWTRDRRPMDWATTQNNLGNALRTLGERDSDTARLKAAVSAFEQALLEWTRERALMNWATVQNNLGGALQALGDRDRDTARLEAAVTAFEQALLERTRDRVPMNWATTQNNLGNALATLGDRDRDTARLEAAVTAYEQALLEWTRDRVPLAWAATQNNLGIALATLGERDSNTARLEASVTAYEQALLERTRERVSLDWAMTQGNLCNLQLAFFDKTGDPSHLDTAQSHLDAAREVFDQAGASHYLAMADEQQAEIDARRAGAS